MTVPMDNASEPLSTELAQRLYKKNTELENELRKSAQAKIPSDPNIWLQMRENYEAIILEDHNFSERHSVESTLWQLHYRRIEEFRSHINSALASRESASNPAGRSLARPERLNKIRSAFKSFLSEATGFYHDLIQKIRSKYGLPLGYFPESAEGRVNLNKDEKRSAEVKKGLLSCHRCLIYLGDLSRYKGLYGEGDAVSRDYAASAAYYTQAASLWPSSGNPHHQLAILASYHSDDLVAIYRYFRSLAVDNPFPTARENLIIAFEKNRQRYSQLLQNVKPSPVKSSLQTNGRGRGRDVKVLAADTKTEPTPKKEQKPNIPEIFKSFLTRFLRLNGILFTRTSLETFSELFLSVISDLCELLASGPDEEFNFGSNSTENGLVIVRIISIIIFTVHNVKRETEGQSYAEILQRSLLLQHAYTVAFEFTGHILKRSLQLGNATSNYLLPGILVFIEWLACHPDIASGDEGGEKLVAPRSFFWNQFLAFVNKLLLSGLISVDSDGDETCFLQMTRYDGAETSNSYALWEDFELRGFSPLTPAQLILDFSSQHPSHGGLKEEKVRMQRIFAAMKVLANVVKVDRQGMYFDPKSRKFIIGKEPLTLEHEKLVSSPGFSASSKQENAVKTLVDFGNLQEKLHLGEKDTAEDEEEEVIVFKPTITEKYPNSSVSSAYEIKPTVQSSSGNLINYVEAGSASQGMLARNAPEAFSHSYTTSMGNQYLLDGAPNTSNWLANQGGLLSNGMHHVTIAEPGYGAKTGLYDALNAFKSNSHMFPFATSTNANIGITLPGLSPVFDAVIPSKLDSILPSRTNFDDLGMKFASAAPVNTKKKPVSRPVRHPGPPPGFSPVPLKQDLELPLKDDNILVDDYSWLDGYKVPATKSLVNGNHASKIPPMFPEPVISDNSFVRPMGFHFSAKQAPEIHNEIISNNGWKDYQVIENLNLYPGKEQYQAQWPSQYHV